MANTTIATDTQTLGLIKLYCTYHKIQQKDFIRLILNRDQDFKEFCKKVKRFQI